MNIYKDIESRTNGEIYVGVVGPVRTGKSTFIKRFMEKLVLPSMADENTRARTRDELPQSANGRTITTSEPKFIPKDSATVTFDGGVSAKIRMIDCVGYLVDGAIGHMEDGKERMVKTPWYDYEIPFSKAAEIGTKRVINDHSTIGIAVFCDGSISDIEHEAYISQEDRTVEELKQIGKPFVIVLNSKNPHNGQTRKLAEDMMKKYDSPVITVDCENMGKSEIEAIFESIVCEFPVSKVNFVIPKWVELMDNDYPVKKHLIEKCYNIFENFKAIRSIKELSDVNDEYIENFEILNIDSSNGEVSVSFTLNNKYYYEMLSQMMEKDIHNEYQLIRELKTMAENNNACIKVKGALEKTYSSGYGFVTPEQAEVILDEPQIIKAGNKYGVKIKASAPSLHLIRANIQTEIAPIVGTKEQAEDLINYISSDNNSDEAIWDVNIFGKTVKQLVEEGLYSKINKINEESKQKLQDTMEKIVNDSNGGMVCIII